MSKGDKIIAPISNVPKLPFLIPDEILIYSGVGTLNNIYYSDSKNQLTTVINNNKIQQISGSNNKYFGVDDSGLLWYNSDYTTTNWIPVPVPPPRSYLLFSINPISYDGYKNILMCITPDLELYYADTNTPTDPNWTLIENVNAYMLSLSNNQVYIIDRTQSKLLYCENYKSNNYNNINIPSNSQIIDCVTFDGHNNILMILCHNENNSYMYYADSNVTTNPNWTLAYMPINNGIIDIPIGVYLSNTRVIVLCYSSYIYYNSSYKSNNWVQAINSGYDMPEFISFDAMRISAAQIITPAIKPAITSVSLAPSIHKIETLPIIMIDSMCKADVLQTNIITIIISIFVLIIIIIIIAVVYFKFIKKDGNNKLVEKGGYYYFKD